MKNYQDPVVEIMKLDIQDYITDIDESGKTSDEDM